MKLGLKVNADTESFIRLSEASPELAEVWFNINDKDNYTELFNELKRRHSDVGLHFWGMLDNQELPNLAYPDEAITTATMRLMKQTIDIAAEHSFQYVNIHPGSAALIKVDYIRQRYDLISEPVDTDQAIHQFLNFAGELHAYATAKHVVFTVETVPPRITDGWYDENTRLTAKNSYELPASAIQMAAARGLWVANDFCHTASNVIASDADVIWTYLRGFSATVAAATRLIHIGFIMPPFNGSDNHDQLDNPILDTDQAVPNTAQMIELLKLFQNRDDVWILAEPKNDHVKNYFLVKKLLEMANNS